MDIQKALRYLEKRVDEAELFYQEEYSRMAQIKGEGIDLFKEANTSGYGIRIIKDKRMGFVYSSTLSKKLLERAIDISRVAGRDNYLTLPERHPYKEVKGTYDRRIPEIEISQIEDFIARMTGNVRDYNVQPTTGAINWSWSKTRLVNTRGVDGREEDTGMMAYLNTVGKQKDRTSSGFHYEISRERDIDFGGLGEKSARLARDSLKAERIDTQNMDIILRPMAVSELLESVFIPSFSADNLQRGRSKLEDKIGKKVFSERINIVDNGLLDGGLDTGMFDGEGTPSKKTTLARKGVLENFIFDCYTGKKGDTESTGNAQRSFSSIPSIGPTNFIIEGETSELGEGLEVYGLIGAHTANPISGDFSVETRNAFLDGRPVKKAIISGNIFDLFKQVVALGKDTKQYSSVVSPSLKFGKVRVTG